MHIYTEIRKIIYSKRNMQLAHYFCCKSPNSETKNNKKKSRHMPFFFSDCVYHSYEPQLNDLEELPEKEFKSMIILCSINSNRI